MPDEYVTCPEACAAAENIVARQLGEALERQLRANGQA